MNDQICEVNNADNASDFVVYDESFMAFAKPEGVGLPGIKRFTNHTTQAREMTFDNLYTPPSGNLDIRPDNVYAPEPGKFDIKPVVNDEVPLSKRARGTASEGTFYQLVGRGPQDVFLTYNPQISFFKQAYKRYTNFAVQTTEERFSTTVRFGTKNICQLSKIGDLAGHMSFKLTLPNLGISGGTWNETIGYNCIGLVRLRIGDTVVQAHEGIYMDIDDKLFCPSEKYDGLSRTIGRGQVYPTDEENTITVPLKFFNCYRPSTKQQFIPILNLQTNIEVFLEFVLKPISLLVTLPAGSSIPDIPSVSASVLVDYVFLDESERYRFAQNPSRFLIEQTPTVDTPTYLTSSGGAITMKDITQVQLRELNKPVKFLATVALMLNDFSSFVYYDIIRSGTFYINSDKQFQERSGDYWRLTQTYQHFTRSIPEDNIFAYSFALNSGSFQPNGFVNFAPYVRTFLSFQMDRTQPPMRLKTVAVALNFLDFSSGTAKLMFN
ncbi:major capsid protein VP54 [Acanthocystis turfacea Chlorella virus MO0605SPH]|uniref:Uncharacterized protein Z558L n=1 Tax=Chlorovirus heliozoae TaxID=322019 RepID=A7K9G8_9PHYC|nr:hypothetical protein ATCV1_Z558L [Acanthocystis turfacea chlorella virus 1]ABT16692.1 hypothetical protein ATCV1_Z558L [Acanthocystis turfacea chlorella virus 1]AGE56045.1 major capsid protein VP54 [Acanthocystis turfacea Chlorella virus MO0605SPH]